MIKVSFAENPLLNETQVLGRVLASSVTYTISGRKDFEALIFRKITKLLLSRDEMALLEMPFIETRRVTQ